MSESWTCEILGEPVGEGRPRAVRIGAGVRMHSAPKSAQWRALAAQQMRAEWVAFRAPHQSWDILDEPVTVRITALTPRPASLPKRAGTGRMRRAVKPDVDNVAKAALDALVTAGVLSDDRCVCTLVVERWTCAVGEAPRVRVAVEWGVA